MVRRPTTLAAALLSGCLFVACGGDVEPVGEGTLALTWNISPRGCSDARVERVEVVLGGEADETHAFDCEEGEAEIGDLRPGNYSFAVFGVDTEGQRTFAGDEKRITVRTDVITRAPHARLTARPVRVGVQWRFDNGRVCGANDVDEIEVAIFDKFDYELDRETFDCDVGGASLGGFSAGTFFVEALALRQGEPVYRGTTTVSVGRGGRAEVEVELSHMIW